VLDAVTVKKVTNETPLSFEELDSPFGFVLYQTSAHQAGLLLGDVSDRSVVLHGKPVVNVAVRPLMISTVVSEGDLRKWTMRTIPLTGLDSSKLKWTGALPVGLPGFVRAYFNVDVIADLFLNPTGLTRGVAFVNGVHVGRYWTVGPHLTLYIRSKFLK
jgi:hypothetical protein